MGKKKQAQRTKNNVVPASSGRSAELLQSSSSVPFVGFSTLKQGGYIPILSGIEELDVNINEDFRLVWKKMNKKDTTTKLKALDEFKKLCQESDVDVLKPVLPFWPRLFCSLSTDEEHRVREAAHAAHRALVSKAGRNIAPYLKQLVGPWFTGQHDTYPPAASAAESSFLETFPPNKVVEAIVFCQEEILSYICNNLLNQTAQSLAQDKSCSQEVKDARYQRVVVSCLNGYALYLQRLPTEHLRKAEEANRKLITSAKFWRFNKDPAPIVRAAWFTALTALCEKAPFLLAEEAKHVCMAVFTNIDETDPTVVQNVWQAVLLTFTVVDDVWSHVSLEKLVLPKLWKVLREGADGNASLVFPNLMPLLSKIPTSLLNNISVFYSKFFDNLRAGLKVRNIQISLKETSSVVVAFLECLRYLISINYKQEKLCLSLFEEQTFPLVEAVMVDSKLQFARPCLFSGLGSLVNYWTKQCPNPSSTLYSCLTGTFWSRMSTLCRSLLEAHVTDATTLASNCAALESLLMALKKPDSQPRKCFKVKFVSPRKSQEEDDEPVVSTEQYPLAPSFQEECHKFVQGQLGACVELMSGYGSRAKVVLIGHLARILEEYDSADIFLCVLRVSQLTWPALYRQEISRWLRDDSVPLDYTLRVIFTLLKYVEDDGDVQTVYADLSGEEVFTIPCSDQIHLEPLKVKWQDVLEWALRPERQSPCVRHWLESHHGLCQLVSQITRQDASYCILEKCLCNLKQNAWLSNDTLAEIIKNLLTNLSDASVAEDVKSSSGEVLQSMLQNTDNHAVLAQLPKQELHSLLYKLFTAGLQRLEHYPSCWQQCVAVISLQSDSDLTFSAVCETCVDLMIIVVKAKACMPLSESQQLVSVLEDLVVAAAGGEVQDCAASLVAVLLNRLAAAVREDCEMVWRLLALTESVVGTPSHRALYAQQFRSNTSKDPLEMVPLQQYVTSMVPFLMMVVRLHTSAEIEATDQFPYAQLRAALPTDDLWDWCEQVLQLQSICVFLKTHFSSTKQYFLLKEKITFILEECGLFSQLRVKDLIRHLNLSVFEDGIRSLQERDDLRRLQRQVIVRDLHLLYEVPQLLTHLLPFKANSLVLRHNYYPDEVLEEIASGESVDRDKLPIINTCQRRAVALRSTCESNTAAHTPHISVLDKVFEQFVAEQKENRSLLHLPVEELDHIAEVVDFACHSMTYDSAHLTQSSWDACLVATAALTLSVNTTLEEWKVRKEVQNSWAQASTSSSQSSPPARNEVDNTISIPLMRVICSVCRLFDAVSTVMSAVDPEDKAAVTRVTEWTDVFLPGTHAALTQAWLAVAETPCDRPALVLLVEALSNSVSRFVQYPHFVTSNTLSCVDVCCRLLQSSQASVQLAAYHLLLKLIPAMIELDMKECEKDNVALSCQHMDKTLIYTHSIIDTILSGLSFGDTCIVEPFTDSYTYVRCYLLTWCALLELCANACSQLRALYTTWLKEEYLPVFMKTVFCLMPESALHGDVLSQRIAQLFAKPPHFDKGVWSSDRLAQVSCWVYGRSLRRLPAAIRQWWNEAEHRVYSLVDHVTASYVSPDLCAEEMRAIQTQEKKFDNMTVHVHPTAKEVYAVYTVEESRMELVIELAHNHPLGLVKVKSGQRMVSTTQTRQWLLQITIFLTHQNGSIWDALELWKTSLDKRFEGVEECYICFAILHSVSHQLPKLSCQTCRKKFHSHCLFKWFTTSNKSTCPICRNLF